MKILMVSGSAKADSSNEALLKGIATKYTNHSYIFADYLKNLPLFFDGQQNIKNDIVVKWKNHLALSDVVIFSTPEYIHNLPALLKNALEWIAASGELVGKKVVAMSYTPNAPRGEKSLQSLLWSLLALDSNVITSISLYKNEIAFNDHGTLISGTHAKDALELIDEFMRLL